MDNFKLPCVPPEMLRAQKVEIYLNDLKKRFKNLRQQHDALIQSSMNIINEIGEVSALSFSETKCIPKIKDLIREFESVSNKETPRAITQGSIGKTVNVKRILKHFEKLTESDILEESILLFKRTKDSLDKIDIFLGEVAEDSKTYSKILGPVHNFRFSQNPLFKFQKIEKAPIRTQFSSCCSSMTSLHNFQSVEDLKQAPHKTDDIILTSNSDMGYHGDIDDSEYDLLGNKKKRNEKRSS